MYLEVLAPGTFVVKILSIDHACVSDIQGSFSWGPDLFLPLVLPPPSCPLQVFFLPLLTGLPVPTQVCLPLTSPVSAYPDQWSWELTPACHTLLLSHNVKFIMFSDDSPGPAAEGKAGHLIQADLKLSILLQQPPECRLITDMG